MKAGPKGVLSGIGRLNLSDLPKTGGERVIRFIEKYLSVPTGKGAGGVFEVQPWQRDIIKGLFDVPRPRQGVLSLPRGNGKSTAAAALAVYALFGDPEPSPQVLIVASDQRQAGIIFGTALKMIEDSPPLADRAVIYADKVMVPETSGVMSALPSDVGALQGWNPSLMLVDELAHVTPDVWEAVTSAAGKRRHSLTLAISTPAPDRDSVMWRLVEYGRTSTDPAFYLKEFGAHRDDDPNDPAVWKRANPALDPSMGRPFLFEDGMRAVQKTVRPSEFARLRLGVWNQGEDAWIDWGDWIGRAYPDRTVSEGEAVVLAFDGSASGDSTALVGCTSDLHVFQLGVWENPGDPRWRVPHTEVEAVVHEAMATYDVLELAADPFGWRAEIEQWDRLYPSQVMEYPTNVLRRMGPACDRFYAAVMEEQITHDGSEELALHVSHCVATSTAYGDLVTKRHQKSPRKIDAAIAAVVALDRAAWHAMNPKPKPRWAVA